MRKKHNPKPISKKNVVVGVSLGILFLTIVSFAIRIFMLYGFDTPEVLRLVAGQVFLPLTCGGENEFVQESYPGLKDCYVRYSDSGTTCTTGTECQSNLCVLPYRDGQVVLDEIMRQTTGTIADNDGNLTFKDVSFPYPQDRTLYGQCLDSHIKGKAATAGCQLTLSEGKITEVHFCPNDWSAVPQSLEP